VMTSANLSAHPSTQPTQIFNYAALDSETRIVVQQRTGEIKEKIHSAAQVTWEIGQKLADVRARLKSRQFTSWIQAEFQLSRRTAYNYINVFESFANCANFAQINIATSALYLLAAPSTPEEAREEALKRANQGESITHAEAKVIRSHYGDVGKLRSGKRVTVDIPALTLERESSTLNETGLSENEDELAEIEPTCYAIPPQVVERVLGGTQLRVDPDNQELPGKEGESVHLTVSTLESLVKSDQEDQFEDSFLEEAEGEIPEVLAQPVEVIEDLSKKELLTQISDESIEVTEAAGSFSSNGYLSPVANGMQAPLNIERYHYKQAEVGACHLPLDINMDDIFQIFCQSVNSLAIEKVEAVWQAIAPRIPVCRIAEFLPEDQLEPLLQAITDRIQTTSLQQSELDN